jgi:hypothetical protein
MAAYQAYQLGNAMPIAAENPAGGVAGAGVGVGMGMAMANRFGGIPGGAPAPAGPQAPAGPPPPPPSWYIVENGQTVGPFTPGQLAQAAAGGRVGSETLVWSAGMSDWVPARTAPALASLLGSTPPPPPER